MHGGAFLKEGMSYNEVLDDGLEIGRKSKYGNIIGYRGTPSTTV